MTSENMSKLTEAVWAEDVMSLGETTGIASVSSAMYRARAEAAEAAGVRWRHDGVRLTAIVPPVALRADARRLALDLCDSADAVMQAMLDDPRLRPADNPEAYSPIGGERAMVEIAEMLRGAIAKSADYDAWVAVSDGLPNEHTDVLVAVDIDDDGCLVQMAGFLSHGRWCKMWSMRMDGEGRYLDGVRYWRQIPSFQSPRMGAGGTAER